MDINVQNIITPKNIYIYRIKTKTQILYKMKEWFKIHIFDDNTEKYEIGARNIWTIVKHGRGTVDLLNVDRETKLLEVSRWKLRTLDMRFTLLL